MVFFNSVCLTAHHIKEDQENAEGRKQLFKEDWEL